MKAQMVEENKMIVCNI